MDESCQLSSIVNPTDGLYIKLFLLYPVRLIQINYIQKVILQNHKVMVTKVCSKSRCLKLL